MSFAYHRLYKLWLCQFDMVSDINNYIKYLITLLHVRYLKSPCSKLLYLTGYTTKEGINMSIKAVDGWCPLDNYYIATQSIKIDSTIVDISYHDSKYKVKIDFEKSEINPKYIKKYENYYIEY